MLSVLKKHLFVLFGTFVVAMALDIFLVPADIAPGGLSGIAIIIHHLTHIPVGISILFLNIPIFLWGLWHFNTGFIKAIHFFECFSRKAVGQHLTAKFRIHGLEGNIDW